MFKSQQRPVVFSQYEHGRLAGTLAQHWGNPSFARPALDFPAFVAGVALHDWGYGLLDNLPIGEAAEDEWLKVIRKGIVNYFDHPTTDIIVKHHLRRLLSLNPSPERKDLISQIDERIAGRLEKGGPSLESYKKADKITQLCDMISFDFCFERPRQRTLAVYAQLHSDETTPITYEIRPAGEVCIDPWPFSIPVISGMVFAFQRQGYPKELQPIVIPYNIKTGL